MSGADTARRVLLTTFTMEVWCPRCNAPQRLTLHWYGDTAAASAAGVTGVHPCPAPEPPPDGAPWDMAEGLW